MRITKKLEPKFLGVALVLWVLGFGWHYRLRRYFVSLPRDRLASISEFFRFGVWSTETHKLLTRNRVTVILPGESGVDHHIAIDKRTLVLVNPRRDLLDKLPSSGVDLIFATADFGIVEANAKLIQNNFSHLIFLADSNDRTGYRPGRLNDLGFSESRVDVISTDILVTFKDSDVVISGRFGSGIRVLSLLLANGVQFDCFGWDQYLPRNNNISIRHCIAPKTCYHETTVAGQNIWNMFLINWFALLQTDGVVLKGYFIDFVLRHKRRISCFTWCMRLILR